MAKDKKAKKVKQVDRRRNLSAQGQLSAGRSSDLRILQQARALWQRNKLIEALALFEQALREHPNHVLATIDASRAFGAAYRFRTAEELLANLLPRIERQPQALHMAGQSYRLLRRPAEARQCFEAAVRLDQQSADTFLELAILYERQSAVEKALEQIDRRLRLIAGDPEGFVVKGRILRRMGKLDSAEALLRRVTRNTKAHWMTRARAFAELATLLDTRESFAEAWTAALRGKRLQKSHATEARRRRRKHLPVFAKISHELTSAQMAAWHQDEADDPDAAKNVLLTGLPRSGTTLLERILNAHPRVVGCDELDAFPRFLIPLMLGEIPLTELTPDRLCRISEDRLCDTRRLYRPFLQQAMGVPLAGRVLVDKNPSLLPVIPLYRRLLPASRLVICLRDPRDVLVSCMLSYLPLNDFSVDFLDLESAVERVRLDLSIWQELRSKLARHWVELQYENLVDDLRGATKPVLAALGLEWDDQIAHYRETGADQQVYSPTYAEVATPIYTSSVGRWKNYTELLEKALPDLQPTVEDLGYS